MTCFNEVILWQSGDITFVSKNSHLQPSLTQQRWNDFICRCLMDETHERTIWWRSTNLALICPKPTCKAEFHSLNIHVLYQHLLVCHLQTSAPALLIILHVPQVSIDLEVAQSTESRCWCSECDFLYWTMCSWNSALTANRPSASPDRRRILAPHQSLLFYADMTLFNVNLQDNSVQIGKTHSMRCIDIWIKILGSTQKVMGAL